jgi:hypothetical protein
MLGFQFFWTAKRTLAGIEATLAKGQVRAAKGDMPAQQVCTADLRPYGPERAGKPSKSAPFTANTTNPK